MPNYIIDLTNNEFSEKIYILSKKINSKYIIVRNGHFSSPLYIRVFLKLKKLMYNFSKFQKKIFINKKLVSENKLEYYAFFEKFNKLVVRIKSLFYQKKINTDIALIAGLEARSLIKKNKKTKIINIGSNDYYAFKNSNKKSIVEKSKFILFMDTILISDEHHQFQDTAEVMNREEFTKQHNKLFEHLENQYNLPILIAGHRRSKHIKGYEKLYPGRQLIFDQTCELTRASEAVVTSISTAVSFAILDYKPIFFYTDSNMDICPWGPFIYSQAKLLGRTIINLDNKINPRQNYQLVDKRKYDEYINKYIFNKSNNFNEKFPWEEFINHYC